MMESFVILANPGPDVSTFGIVLKIFGGCALVAAMATALYAFIQSKRTVIDFDHDSSKHRILHLSSLFLRFFLAALLIFSGAVKIIDPLGTAYKMQDYYTAFDAQMSESYLIKNGESPPSDIWYTKLFSALKQVSIATAVVMVVVEIVLGILLFLGIYKRIVIPLTAIMLVFFTFLTGYTAQTGEPSDCGCFGDFIKLRPIDSFYKDIILCAVISCIWLLRSYIKPMVRGIIDKRVTLISMSAIAFLFAFSNYMFGLPLIDFRPYKVGSDIGELTKSVPDVYEYRLCYFNKQSGEKVFLDNDQFAEQWSLYSDTSVWEFMDRQETLIQEGIPAKIDFSVLDSTGHDLAGDHFKYKGITLWVCSGDPMKASARRWEELNDLYSWAQEKNYRMHAYMECGGNSINEVLDKIEEEKDVTLEFPCYASDGKVLKTAIRANPGLIIVKDGIIIEKFHHTSYPTETDLDILLH